MKKFGVSLLVVLMAMGLVVMFSGCGDDDDDDGLPKSDAAYAGSNEAAYIGTDDGGVWNFDNLLYSIGQIISDVQTPPVDWDATGSGSDSGEYEAEGSTSGTYRETWEETWDESETSYSEVEWWEGNFSDFMDSGDQYPYVLEGEGSFYTRDELAVTFTGEEEDGIILIPEQVGSPLTVSMFNYVNYDDHSIRPSWEPPYLFSLDGFVSVENDLDYENELCGTSYEGDVSYSWATSEAAGHIGLLNSEGTMAYDGSDTTLVASGTICAEGEIEFPFEGCVDFEMDVAWENFSYCMGGEVVSLDSSPIFELPYYPDSGTVTVTNGTETAVYDYGADPDPWCFLYLLDADNDGAYEYSDVFCD